MLKEARKLARTLPPEKRAAIEEMCNEIEALMKELADLQARGLVRGREGGWWRGEEEWKIGETSYAKIQLHGLMYSGTILITPLIRMKV